MLILDQTEASVFVDRRAPTAGAAVEAAGRDPNALRFGAFVDCAIHDDREVAREAITRFEPIHETGIDFVRVAPGSRDTPHVAARSIQALAEVVAKAS